MKRQSFLTRLLNAVLLCSIVFCNTACVNSIGEDAETELEEGTIPISFSVKIKKATTKVTGNLFEKGDQMGLIATTSSSSIKGKRYINNLPLEYTEGSTLVPKKTVFYPEGDVPLNFISYYPYQSEGVPEGTSTLPVSVQTDQSNEKSRSQSDFLVATAKNITGKSKTVALEFQHKLAKLTVTLIPDTGNKADNLLKANPRIIATGFKTSADYNLEDGTFANLEGTKDIIASGVWSVKDNKLVGKEIIIIPQAIEEGKYFFIIEWSGRLYSCAIPSMKIGSNMQCSINVSAIQSTSNILNGFAGQIKAWENVEAIETDNTADYTAIHLSALSFSQSNIYRVYHEGMPVAEICQEYLRSGTLTSRALTAYPMGENEKADLSNGIVLQLMDCTDNICGGKISWNTYGHGFSYTQGDTASVDKLYIDAAHKLSLRKPENAVKVNVASHTLLDIRKGIIDQYPITKIGKQYWMGKELRATSYRNGTNLSQQTALGKDKAGYYKPDGLTIYFYNGEAILAGELAPEGWKIPSDEDWEALKEYLGNDASVLKAGEWQTMISGEPLPTNNHARFNAFPVGMWYKGAHYSAQKMTAFWSWDKTRNTLSENTVYFLGESNEFIRQPAHITGQDYYKALSIRCIKE